MSLEAVKQLLRKRDYIITVQQSGDGCIVTYPRPILLMPNKRLVETYTLKRSDGTGLLVNTTFLESEKFIPLPEYAIRPFLAAEIEMCCRQIMVDISLVDYISEDGAIHDNLGDIVASPSTNAELQREAFLSKLIVEARVDGFPSEFEKVAETHEVLEGYQTIRTFFKDSNDE
jgi:hypothetical protein